MPTGNHTAAARAEQSTPGLKVVGEPRAAVDDPHRLARSYLDKHGVWRDPETGEEYLSLVVWQDGFLRWSEDHGCYREVRDGDLTAELTASIKDDFDAAYNEELGLTRHPNAGPLVVRKVTKGVVTNTIQALRSMARIPGDTDQPAWLYGDPIHPVDEVLPARNRLLHLPTLAIGYDQTTWPTPRYFSAFALPYDFEPETTEPAEWLWFLHELWGEDRDSIDSLQEWFGYLLTADTAQQKILGLIGPKRSGKGTIFRVLKELVGPENVCSPTLGSLAGPFGLQPLIGRHAAIISDARLSGRSDQSSIVERLLSVSGEDSQTVARKHTTAWHGKLPTRFVIVSNEVPKLQDASGALAGRLIVLRLVRSFFGKEDPDLTRRLCGELPGILLWAVAGWKRLRDRRRFVQPESGQRLVEELEDISSPVGAFVRECCLIVPGHLIEVGRLYEAWKRWCGERGREQVGHQDSFGRDLLAAVPSLDKARQRRVEGERHRFYEGITLREEFAGFGPTPST